MPNVCESVATKLKEWIELKDVMWPISANSKINHEQGTNWFLTRNFIDRKSNFAMAVASALAPWLHEDLYNEATVDIRIWVAKKVINK